MATVTICNDFEGPKYSLTLFPLFSYLFHEVMGPDAMIFVFWMLSFKPTFSLSSFTFIKRLFSSSLLSAKGWCHVHIWGYWYFSWQSWLLTASLIIILLLNINLDIINNQSVPGGTSDKEPNCQCWRLKRCRFTPWVRKIPWRKA